MDELLGKKIKKMSNFHFFPKTLKIASPHPLKGGFFSEKYTPLATPSETWFKYKEEKDDINFTVFRFSVADAVLVLRGVHPSFFA